MPTYDMRNKETGEITEHRMSYKVLDEFLVQNPNLEVYHSAENLPIMSDAMRLSVPGLKKADSGFEKNVIARIRDKVPGNTLAGHKSSGHNISEY
jgi:hypothetical protein